MSAFWLTCMCFIGGDEQCIWHEIKGPRGKIITIITNASLLRNVHIFTWKWNNRAKMYLKSHLCLFVCNPVNVKDLPVISTANQTQPFPIFNKGPSI